MFRLGLINENQIYNCEITKNFTIDIIIVADKAWVIMADAAKLFGFGDEINAFRKIVGYTNVLKSSFNHIEVEVFDVQEMLKIHSKIPHKNNILKAKINRIILWSKEILKSRKENKITEYEPNYASWMARDIWNYANAVCVINGLDPKYVTFINYKEIQKNLYARD